LKEVLDWASWKGAW